MPNPTTRTIIGTATLAAVAGCAPTPYLAVPPAVLSDNWSRPATSVANNQPTSLADLLKNQDLAALIDRALSGNPDILAARSRIDKALAGWRIARGSALPLVTIGSGGSASRLSGSGPFDFAASFASLDASLSLDFGGGAKAGSRAAGQRLRAARLDRDAMMVVLVSEVARTFVQRATLGSRIALLGKNIAQAEKLQRILEIRKREGVATQVDVGLQTIRVQQLMAERNRLDQALDQTRTALALLAGEEAPTFSTPIAALDSFSLDRIAVPRPADLILARPDVAAAEARILAAGGDVDQARAAFRPRIDLSISRLAQGALSGGPLTGLNLGAELLLPIFGRNRLRGNLDVASADQRESVQNYRRVLLSALAEVEDALSAVNHASERYEILKSIEREANRTAGLAQAQYLEGDADLRAVLDAQDLLVSAQDACAVSMQEQLEASIALYKATRRSP